MLVAVSDGRGIRLGEVADGERRAGRAGLVRLPSVPRIGRLAGGVTLAIAKRPGRQRRRAGRPGARAAWRTSAGACCRRDLRLTVTRNYGETANEKAIELLSHILIATLGVALLVWLALGWREAVVVLVAVPVTLALTLLVYRLLGYTLNRITLFALVFAIGILVDDAIVVVENIARHLGLRRGSPDGGGGGGRWTRSAIRPSSPPSRSSPPSCRWRS